MSVAAPYRHFADKQALLSAILADGLRDLSDNLATAASGNELHRLRALGHRFIDLVVAEPDLFRLLAAADTHRHADPEFLEAERAAFASFADTIAEAEQAGAIEVDSIESATLTMRCVMQGLAALIASNQIPTEDAHAVADRVMSVVDRGLLTRN